jgi:hypothetical protein
MLKAARNPLEKQMQESVRNWWSLSPMILYLSHKIDPLDSIPSQMNAAHVLSVILFAAR